MKAYIIALKELARLTTLRVLAEKKLAAANNPGSMSRVTPATLQELHNIVDEAIRQEQAQASIVESMRK